MNKNYINKKKEKTSEGKYRQKKKSDHHKNNLHTVLHGKKCI